MSSSMLTSSSSCSAVCVFDRTSSSRLRSCVMSARIRSRSGLSATWECAVTIATSSTTIAAANLPPRIVTQRMPGSLLLRLLLRRSLAAGEVIPDFHFHDESLVVIGTDFVDDVVFRKLQTLPLSQLLQRGLVVVKEQIVFIDRFEIALERRFDQAPRRLDLAVEKNCGDDGLTNVVE